MVCYSKIKERNKNELRVYNTLYVHVFVVMGVSDCENFRFGYRVIVTLLGCVEFIMLVWIRLSTYWVLR